LSSLGACKLTINVQTTERFNQVMSTFKKKYADQAVEQPTQPDTEPEITQVSAGDPLWKIFWKKTKRIKSIFSHNKRDRKSKSAEAVSVPPHYIASARASQDHAQDYQSPKPPT
jgi:hypothetical protein